LFPEDGIVRQFFSIEGAAGFSTANASQPIGAWSPVFPGESRLRLDFTPRYKQLVLRLDGSLLERSMASLLGDTGDRKLVFSSDKPDSARMSFVRQDLFRLVDELDRFGPDYSPIAISEIERNLVF